MKTKYLLLALGLALTSTAHAAESHRNVCTGLMADGSKMSNAAMIMHWSLTNINLKAGTAEYDFPVTGVRGRIGETDMVLTADGSDGKIRFTMPLDGMTVRGVPDTLTVHFSNGMVFTGVCVPRRASADE